MAVGKGKKGQIVYLWRQDMDIVQKACEEAGISYSGMMCVITRSLARRLSALPEKERADALTKFLQDLVLL